MGRLKRKIQVWLATLSAMLHVYALRLQIQAVNTSPPNRSALWERSPHVAPKPFEAVRLPEGDWGVYFLDGRAYVLRHNQLVLYPDLVTEPRYQRKDSG